MSGPKTCCKLFIMNSQWQERIIHEITRGLMFSFLSKVYDVHTGGPITGILRQDTEGLPKGACIRMSNSEDEISIEPWNDDIFDYGKSVKFRILIQEPIILSTKAKLR